MHRRNFGGTSGIIVDVCALHGIWFEAGELEAVLAFVRQGGLEAARERHARATSLLGVPASQPSVPFTPVLADRRLSTLGDLGEGVIELIEFLHDVLRAGRNDPEPR